LIYYQANVNYVELIVESTTTEKMCFETLEVSILSALRSVLVKFETLDVLLIKKCLDKFG
jgi:hypothetical protein